jgi:hypothetical protein
MKEKSVVAATAPRAGDLQLAIEQLRVAIRELPEAGRRTRAADELASALILVQGEEAAADLTEVVDQFPERRAEVA